jgi:serine/threonine protein kinase
MNFEESNNHPLVFPEGTQINHYEIVKLLGSGSMGDVYLAVDNNLKRKVALKFLSSKLATKSEYKDRFIREARSAASVEHPNIVTVYENGEYKGRLYIAMQYVEGEQLSDIIEKGNLTVNEITDIIKQISKGLEAAHRNNLLHRDIKPQNIILDKQKTVKILDFGLAKIFDQTYLTSDGSSMGTVPYMSPEQLKGEVLTASSDLFALGIIWYQMLMKRLPFDGEYDASIIYSIINEEPEKIISDEYNISEDVKIIVKRLLSKNSKDRYQSASELLEDLGEGADKAFLLPIRFFPNNRKRLYSYLSVLVIAIMFVVGYFNQWFGKSESEQIYNSRIAVLPFENLGLAEESYFAEGITDAITLDLAKFSDLEVISRKSSILYKDTDKSIEQIGNELDVEYILTGTIQWQKSEDSSVVRISSSLISTENQSYLWTESFVSTIDNLFSLQSKISNRITQSLDITIKADLTGTKPTTNLAAYDYYLRGNKYFNQSWEKYNIEIALNMYQHAIELDPKFAAAYAMLSRANSSMYWEYYDHTEERKKAAYTAAMKSLELDKDLVEGNQAMGYYYYHCNLDYENALEQFMTGLLSQPNNSDLLNAVAVIQRRQSNLEDALDNFEKAFSLDPRSNLKALDIGLTFAMIREYTKADDYLQIATNLAPEMPLNYIFRAWLSVLFEGNINKSIDILNSAEGRVDLSNSKYYWWIMRILKPDVIINLEQIVSAVDPVDYYIYKARAFHYNKDYENALLSADSAMIILQEYIEIHPEDAHYQSLISLAYAYKGDKQQALIHGQISLELLPTTKDAFDAPFNILNMAEVLVLIGENEKAIDNLEYLLTIPGFVSPYYFQLDPLWEPLRENPRFIKLSKLN